MHVKTATKTKEPTKAAEARDGTSAPQKRAQAYEEFASRIGDHEIVEGVLTKLLSPADTKPITMVVDDATLACLEHDWRVKEAVEKTGHPFRDILKNCQLVLDGQPDYPSTWPIRWPCGFIPEEHGRRIRAVLFLVWAFSADDLGDDDLMHRHDRAVDWMAHYVAGVDLTAARVRLDAEDRKLRKQRQGLAKARNTLGKKGEATAAEVERRWKASTRTEHERVFFITKSMNKDGWKISKRWVRQIIADRKLRTAQTKGELH